MKIIKKYSKGISLIEILAIVAILAVLILLGIRSYVKQVHKGNDARRKADLDRIKIAVEEYERDYNCYPDPEDMDECGTGESIAIHPYLSNVPCDPVTGEPYPYEVDGLTCPRWFKFYTLLQNQSDINIIPWIGPENRYNYYISSANAPLSVSSPPSTQTSIPSPSSSPSTEEYMFGCKGGVCTRIYYDQQGEPECQPNYDDSSCYGQCGTVYNPASECI